MTTIILKRTNSENTDFQSLVQALNKDLAIRNGDKETNDFFVQFNQIDQLNHVVVAYKDNELVGCGAMKEYTDDVFTEKTMEIKRMFVPVSARGLGIATKVLQELERWASELDYARCILETGDVMPEAIALYKKCEFQVIQNYGQYANVDSSLCFEKVL